MGAFGLPRTADLPIPAKFRNRQFSLHGGGEGTEALAVVAVEAHRGLGEPMTGATLT
jgi:hypothetical protein